MLSIALGIAGALLAKGKKENEVLREVERRADLLDKEYYTTEDVAKISGLSDYTVRKKIREGELPAEGEGNRSGYRIRKEELLDFLFKQRTFTRNYERASKTWTEEELSAHTSSRRREEKMNYSKAAGIIHGKSMGTVAAGVALLGTLGVVAPIVGLTAAALFNGKKEVSEKEIEAMSQLLVNARLLRQYISMKEKLLEQLKLEEEEMQIFYNGKLESDEYRLKEIEQKKKINDAELEMELLQSQLEELEKNAKKN